MSLTFGELCAGASGFGLGFAQAGMTPGFWVEIDPNCRKLLAAKYPGLPNHDDITTFNGAGGPAVDVLCGGTPCQGFSVAGLRGSMSDDRSNLCLHFCRIADELEPVVIVWENVPGVLSTPDNAFGCFLARLVGADAPLVPPAQCRGRWTNAGVAHGPRRTAAWRCLDGQFFGLAQRRNRVFVVASARKNLPFEILFESPRLRRDPPAREEAREGVAGTLGARTKGGGGLGTDLKLDGGLIAAGLAPTLNAHFGAKQGLENQHIDGGGLFVAIGQPLPERGRDGAAGLRNGDAASDATRRFL